MARDLPYFAHLTLRSANEKTGPIPVSVTDSRTCPPNCTFKGQGCYAESGPLGIHWRHVDEADRGMPWEMFCAAVDTLGPGQVWRHNAAGDLPGRDGVIDQHALGMLVKANAGKVGFTYTHYPPTPVNAAAIGMANAAGFVINLSSNNVAQADAYAELGVGPVVTVLPSDTKSNTTTPAGRPVVVCPATTRVDTNCQNCRLCAVADRQTVIGFPAHGSSKRRVDIMIKEIPHGQQH